MADKEERILVLTTHNKDGECECVMQDGCHANDSCSICNVGMSRQAAINRMAKALEEKSEQMARECLNSDPYNNHCGAEDLAEAALNALLEDNK